MGPFKCPDCGVWWAGFEHRCINTAGTFQIGNWTVSGSCNCAYDANGRRIRTTAPCPTHDVSITYTLPNTAGSIT